MRETMSTMRGEKSIAMRSECMREIVEKWRQNGGEQQSKREGGTERDSYTHSSVKYFIQASFSNIVPDANELRPTACTRESGATLHSVAAPLIGRLNHHVSCQSEAGMTQPGTRDDQLRELGSC